MKRFARRLAIVLAVAAILAVSAFAADFTHCADALHDLGLFQGTDSGYDLDRAPTRAEAAAMLVRLLGAEEEAQAMESYTAPFTDVRDWAKPYVQYLYDNGLTNGVTETLFGASNTCTAQQYATFLLRALGYSDGTDGDFTYATALQFAREMGVVDDLNCDPDNFLRDDVAAMSFTALACAPKSGEADLLTKLVEDGAVEDAKGYDEMFEAYRAYVSDSAATADETAISMDTAMGMDISIAGEPLMNADIDMTAAAIMDLEAMDQSRMAYTMDMTISIDPEMAEASGLTAEEAATQATIQYWYADGIQYMDAMGQKVKMPLSFEEFLGQLPVSEETASAELISAFQEITRTVRGSTTEYTLTYANAPFNSMIRTILALAPTEQAGLAGDLTISELSMTATYRNGRPVELAMDMAMTMEAEGQTMAVTVDMEITDIVLGDSVTVTLPDDLDTYPDISEIATPAPEAA